MPFGGDRDRFGGFPSSNINNNFDGRYNVTTEANDKNSNQDKEEDEEEKEFKLFDSLRYGVLRNLMFSDNTRRLARIEVDQMSYKVCVI